MVVVSVKKAIAFLAILFLLLSCVPVNTSAIGGSYAIAVYGKVYYSNNTTMGGAVVSMKDLRSGYSAVTVSNGDLYGIYRGNYSVALEAPREGDTINITIKKDNDTFYFPEFQLTYDEVSTWFEVKRDIYTNISDVGRPTAIMYPLVQEVSISDVVFFNGTLSSPYNESKTIWNYTWDYGDGTKGYGATSYHNYSAGGTYKVTLTVTQNDGKTGTMEGTINVFSNATDFWSSAEILGVSIIVLGALITIGITTGIILYLTRKRRKNHKFK